MRGGGNVEGGREGEGERQILKKNLHTTLPNHQITWDIDITVREKDPIRKQEALSMLSKPRAALHALGWLEIM